MMKSILLFVFIYLVSLSSCMADINFDLSNLKLNTDLYNNNSSIQVKKEFFGVAPGGGNEAFSAYKYYSSLNEISPDVVRLEAITADYRNLYNPQTKLWDYSQLDNEIEKMSHGKRTIIANIFYTPKFLSSCPDSKFYAFCTPNDLNAWSFYVTNIVQHVYQKYGIKYWEIGNEPSGKFFFKGSMSSFFKFYIETAKAIKKVDNNILVGGFADNAFYVKAYSDFFTIIRKYDPNLLNFVTFHWYGDWGGGNGKYNPKDIFSISEKLKETMDSSGFSGMPIFLTEWNLVGNNPPPWGGDQVASYFVASEYWLQKSPIDKSLFFRVEPYNNTNASLLDSNGKKNNVAEIFSILSNIDTKNIYMQDNIYVFFNRTRREVVLSNYDLSDSSPKEVTLDIGKVDVSNCQKSKYKVVIYSNERMSNGVSNLKCSGENAFINLVVKNFDVIHVSY